MKPVALTLTKAGEWTADDGRQHRHEEWSLVGGEIDPDWRKGQADNWEPSCRFTLYIVDGVIDRRLASYGGAAWPTAWRDLFEAKRPGTYFASVDITDKGLSLRASALADRNSLLEAGTHVRVLNGVPGWGGALDRYGVIEKVLLGEFKAYVRTETKSGFVRLEDLIAVRGED